MNVRSGNVSKGVTLLGVAAFGPALALGLTGAGSASSPWVIATVMVASGVLCTAAAGASLVVSVRLRFTENALVAAAFTAAGLLVLAHGLFSPGAFFDGTGKEFGASGQLSALFCIPTLALLLATRDRLDRSSTWRTLSLLIVVAAAGTAITLFFTPFFTPFKPETASVALAAGVAIIVQLLAARHFAQLAARFDDHYSAALAAALTVNAAVPVFFYFGGPGSGAYWWAHGMCMIGVSLAAIAIWFKARQAQALSMLVGSVVTTKPMRELQVDIAPAVLRSLKSITDPGDPRLAVVYATGDDLAAMSVEQDLRPASVLPILKRALQAFEAGAVRS